MTGLVDRLIAARWFALALVVVGTAVAVPQLAKLQVDNSNESFFMEGDNTKLRLDEFQATFGNDDFVFLLIGAEDAFDPALLKRVGSLTERLEAEVPHLLEVTWLGTVEAIDAVPGGIVIDELLPAELWDDAEALARQRARALGDPLYVDRLVSADAGLLGVLLEFENYPAEGVDPRKDSPPVIKAILADYAELDFFLVGSPIMDYEMDARTALELPRWMSFTLIGMTLALLLTTRSVVGALVPACTVVLSVIWTMAIVAQLGYTLNLLVILVPCLLLCVGIGDSMHVVAEYRQHLVQGDEPKEALRRTLALVSWPILLTTITTAAGFLAFLATDLKPLRELGIQAAIGVWVALLLTYLFAVPALAVAPAKQRAAATAAPAADLFDRFLGTLAGWVNRAPQVVFLLFLVASLAAGYGASQL
ncbi:MAG: MMPL family transporter, partial [Pseudomonadota bacterium]